MDTAVRQPVLVTGASGFIGGPLVRRLIEHHSRVSCLVRLQSRGNVQIEDLRSAGAALVTGDVTDRGSVERALAESQAGAVFHLAGLVRARSLNEFNTVNEGGVENVAAVCASRAGPPVLVVVSSLAAAGPGREDRLRVEGDVPEPISNYGRSKLAGERAAAKYARAAPITIVRPPMVFGPGDQGMLQLFRPIARSGVHGVPGWRGGGHRFSLTHVDDLVEGLLLAAQKGERLREHASPGQGIYFMAGGHHPTFAELGLAIAKALGQKPPRVMPVPGPLLRVIGLGGDVVARLRGRPGWVSSDKITEGLAGSWTCSSAKARTQLGWSPAVGATLADRLHETAEWYRRAGWL